MLGKCPDCKYNLYCSEYNKGLHVGLVRSFLVVKGNLCYQDPRGEAFEGRIWGTFLVKTKIEVYKKYTGMSIHHHI